MRTLGRNTVVVSASPSNDAAERLAEALRSLQSGGDLLIDLTRAEKVEAVLLAQLASHLRMHCHSASVRILGLRQHDCRLLRYLGLEVDASGCAAPASNARSDPAQASG